MGEVLAGVGTVVVLLEGGQVCLQLGEPTRHPGRTLFEVALLDEAALKRVRL